CQLEGDAAPRCGLCVHRKRDHSRVAAVCLEKPATCSPDGTETANHRAGKTAYTQGADMLRVTGIGIGCVAVVLGGCAANDERVAASFDDDIARAAAIITEAEGAGAYEHGSAALNMAR